MKWILIAVVVATLSGAGVAFASSLSVDSDNVTVFKNTLASPTLTVTPSVPTIAAGGSATAAATLSAYGITPTGTVTFTVYTDASCATLFATPENVVAVSVPVTTSNAVTFATAGSYYWLASYSGDGNNQPVTSACSTALVVS